MEVKKAAAPRFKQQSQKAATFEYYAPSARSVSVAGTFSNWDAKMSPLKKDKNGTWKTTLSLASGRYEYRYLVDGNWESDQRPVESVPNTFGSWNCVITIE